MSRSTLIEALPAEIADSLSAIGESVAKARATRGMSQADLARRMFVSRQTLHRLETGDPSIGLAVLAAALFVLGQGRRLRLLADPDGPVRGKHQRSAAGANLDF